MSIEPYTGRVTPGEPAAVRELEAAIIRKLAVTEMHNNVYLVTCRTTGEQLLIDAAGETERVLELVAAGGPRLSHLVTTHRHWDHTRALVDVAAATGARTYAGALDADDIPLAPDVRLSEGDTVRVGELTLAVSHLQGHTPGHVVLALTEGSGRVHLFTGDCLFPGGVGATQMFDYQSFEQLYADVVAKIFDRYGDDTWVYPGHGDDTTLGAERDQLAEWQARGW